MTSTERVMQEVEQTRQAIRFDEEKKKKTIESAKKTVKAIAALLESYSYAARLRILKTVAASTKLDAVIWENKR